jgi:hypothetical protein
MDRTALRARPQVHTSALSNVAIAASAGVNLAFNALRRRPGAPPPGGPLIDYDLLVLLGAPIVVGSILGSYANFFIPVGGWGWG